MPKPTGPTSDRTRKVIAELRKNKDEQSRDIARMLEKPTRSKNAVNLQRISRANGDVAVAGKVLGIGELKKPVTVYALSYSKSARKKIEGAKGKALPLSALAKDKAKVKLVK